jgi:sec-independent protein translocase protein TatB
VPGPGSSVPLQGSASGSRHTLAGVFNLTGSEIVVILLLALVILGPDKLPDAMRKAGRTWAELKKLSNGFQDEMRKGFEEPAAEVKKTATAVKQAASFANAPVKSAQKSAKGAVKSLLDPPKAANEAANGEAASAESANGEAASAESANGKSAAGESAAPPAQELPAEPPAAAAEESPATADTMADVSAETPDKADSAP